MASTENFSFSSICLNNNILYLSHKGNPGRILTIAMLTLKETVIIENETVECSESTHLALYLAGIVYMGIGSLQIKTKICGEEAVGQERKAIQMERETKQHLRSPWVNVRSTIRTHSSLMLKQAL